VGHLGAEDMFGEAKELGGFIQREERIKSFIKPRCSKTHAAFGVHIRGQDFSARKKRMR